MRSLVLRMPLLAAALAALVPVFAQAQVTPFPAAFRVQRIDTNGSSPLLWHFHFGGPDMERLVEGRERIYLDHFWNDFSADPKRFDEASRRHYAKLYALPGAMHSGFQQFHAFDRDAADNKGLVAKGLLPMPVLAIGGQKSFATTKAVVARAVASNVQGAVIPDSGHWLMEEQPGATMAAITGILQ